MRRALCIVMAMAAGVRCGSSAPTTTGEDDTPNEPGPPDADQPEASAGGPKADAAADVVEASVDLGPACAAYAQASCAKRQACAADNLTIFYADMDACVGAQAESCTRWAAAPGSSWTPAALQSCATVKAAATCSDYESGDIAACSLPGTLALNKPCAFSPQCQTGFCSIDFGEACGVCFGARPVGDFCFNGCGPGMRCGASNRCVVEAKNGDVCDQEHWCGYGLICGIAEAGATAGTCIPRPATEGASCDPGGPPCDSEYAKLVCDSATKQCVAMSLVAAGQACSATSLCKNGYCMSTCRPWHPEGEQCSDGVPCVDGFACMPASGSRQTCQKRTAAICL